MRKSQKNDEFYTQYKDIESEMEYWIEQFKDKIIYCNCDNPRYSNFFKYFYGNFKRLKLKELISTFYSTDESEKVYKLSVRNINNELIQEKTYLKENGSFDSYECLKILKEDCDIVITNPPFSLMRKYLELVYNSGKDFVILGGVNVISYSNIFPMVKKGKIKSGYLWNKTLTFTLERGGLKTKEVNCCFYTSFSKEDNKKFDGQATYTENENKYPFYANCEGINVDKVKDIPIDYNNVMGVPITFFGKLNYEEFEIVGMGSFADGFESTRNDKTTKYVDGVKTGKPKYSMEDTLFYPVEQANRDFSIMYKSCVNDLMYVMPYIRLLIKRK